MGARRKKRPLTEILQSIGKETVITPTGVIISKEELLASMMWEWVVNGRVAFNDSGRVLEASARDWKDSVQWIYQHADGPASKDLVIDFGMEEELGEMTIAELQAVVAQAVDEANDDGDSDSGVTAGVGEDRSD